MKKTILKFSQFFLIMAAMILTAGPAKADYDALIKVTCDKERQTITLTIPYPHADKSVDQIVEDIQNKKVEDGYSFTSMAATNERANCDLGNGHTISFAAFKNEDHPRNDNIGMFIDQAHTSVWFATLPMQVEIHMPDINDYTVKHCFSEPPPIGLATCTERHFVNGICVKSEPHQKGCL